MSLKRLIAQQRVFYDHIGPLVCPILNETVYFNSEGFNHLLYKRYKEPRPPEEQFMKLKCLTHVPKVVKECSQEVTVRPVRRKIKRKWKNCTHYELVHEVKRGAKIRVIIEKIGTIGNYHFRSVMPNDNKSKKILTKTKRRS